jgi:hypothetical protein
MCGAGEAEMKAELESYGFKAVGRWVLYPEVKSGITFVLTQWEEKRAIYAFVVGDEVKYIGICEKDSTTLKARMQRYKSRAGRSRQIPGGGSTNERNASQIKKCLERREAVQIYALAPQDELLYHELRVDLVKGLENPLIARFQPEWNRHRPQRRRGAKTRKEITFRDKVVTQQAILSAIQAFDAEYPNTNDYKGWLEKGNYKYALLYKGKKYPPKHILIVATGTPWQEFGGGVQQTNRVLCDLGFTIVTK